MSTQKLDEPRYTELEHLGAVLGVGPWVIKTYPFPHCTAGGVFREDFYLRLATNHAKILSRGYFERHEPGCFSRRIAGYDAYSLNVKELPASDPLRIFTSRAWHDLLALVSGVDATGDINAVMHSHLPGGRGGNIHNDLNPGFFVDDPSPDGINIADWRSCDYQTGNGAGTTARKTIRAAAMLYYLNNGPWQQGDGGETGLYAGSEASVDQASVKIPPVDNSLVLFECAPYSFHTFIGNKKLRHCLIVWLHRPVSTVVGRWGKRSIVEWTYGS